MEQYVCEKLGLTPDPLSTQVLARDRHAQVMTALAVTASTLESIAMQVRLLQQSDVIEAEEPFAKVKRARRQCLTSATLLRQNAYVACLVW